ncbi:MAG: hypothetical protein PHH77_03635 [Victivallaceae bacterium]|nr:hypothetical protein [Victivallaceae bacterium]
MTDDPHKTDSGNISDAGDTRTRKTLKLKPITKAEQPAAALGAVIDPLTQRNTDTGPLGTLRDTRTRKTVKLKPITKAAETGETETVAGSIADPLTKRNTDTGPLGELDNTRTRKTVKLKPIAKTGQPAPDLGTVIDPLTQRNTETGPLGELDDTRTRKTVTLKPVVSKGEEPAAAAPPPADSTAVVDPLTQRNTETGSLGTLVDTRTRKTIKLKPLKSTAPIEAPAAAPAAPAETENAGKTLPDTNTRKTLKLKPLVKEPPAAAVPSSPPPPATELPEAEGDTHTRKTVNLFPAAKADQKAAEELLKPVEPETAEAAEAAAEGLDDTIKIQRPPSKAGAIPMPSLGVTMAAKTVNNKATIKLHPTEAAAEDKAAQASKQTVKLSPQPPPEKASEAPEVLEEVEEVEEIEEIEEEAEEKKAAPSVNLKLNMGALKSKLVITKTPDSDIPPEAETPASESKTGRLKLQAMKPKIEAPRTVTDQEKILELKAAKQNAAAPASAFYTLVALITIVLVLFSALVTAVQYFNIWNPQATGGQKIELPYLKIVK